MATEGEPNATTPPLDRAARLALLANLDWARLTKRLTSKASRRGANPMLAEDLARDTVTHAFRSGASSWDPDADPTGFRYLLYVLDWKHDAYLTRQTAREEKAPTEVDTEKAEETPPESDRGEADAIANEAILRNLERLRTRLAGFPVTLALLEYSVKNGQQKPSVSAEALGVSVQQIYTAEAQLLRHARRLRSDGSDPDVRAEAARRAEPESAT